MNQHEPDWESLSEINFLMYRRMSEHLNAALAAITLLNAPEARDNPEFWRERALNEVERSLNLHNAWASLVRYKLGETFLPQHMLQFRASEMLQWLAVELQIPNAEPLGADMLLFGNRETLQEALLMIHSCAGTLGPSVILQAQIEGGGMWFRVLYQAIKSTPTALDTMMIALEKMSTTWRAQGVLFELKRARDFLAMNNCELLYKVEDGTCELSFFVNAVSQMERPTTTVRAFEVRGTEETSVVVATTAKNSAYDTSSANPRPPASSSR